MRAFTWIAAAVNLYVGLRAFLNAVGILRTSKYAHATDVVAAILFLSLGAAGVWIAASGGSLKLGLALGLGPWVVGGVLLFVSMTTGSYQ